MVRSLRSREPPMIVFCVVSRIVDGQWSINKITAGQ